MNDEFFDPIDSDLRRRFDAASPRTPGDPDAVLDGLRPQMRAARTRHRAALGGMAAGVVAIIAVAGFALTGGTSSPKVNTPPASHSSVPDTRVSTPTVPSMPDGSGLKDSGTNGGGAFNDGANQTGDTGSGSSGSTGGSGSDATPTTVGAPSQSSYSSAGGSITVQLSGGQVSLVSATPAAGLTYEVHDNGPDQVEVRFSDSEGEVSRIRVELVNGALVRTT
jgi:hypothetical protein